MNILSPGDDSIIDLLKLVYFIFLKVIKSFTKVGLYAFESSLNLLLVLVEVMENLGTVSRFLSYQLVDPTLLSLQVLIVCYFVV